MFSQIMGISIISYVRMRKLQFAFSALQNSKTILFTSSLGMRLPVIKSE